MPHRRGGRAVPLLGRGLVWLAGLLSVHGLLGTARRAWACGFQPGRAGVAEGPLRGLPSAALAAAPRRGGGAAQQGLRRGRRWAALPPVTEADLELIREWEAQEEALDDAAAEARIREADFPIAPEELIARAKLYLAKNQNGVVAPEMLAENFTFSGPVIGPLRKEAFINVLGSFDLLRTFPDNRARWHHFRVDPFDPSRVLFTARATGTNLADMPPLVTEPDGTGKAYVGPPEAASLKFLRDGTIEEYTAAYVMDKNQGNTGGMTGIFGMLYAIGRGLPIPEAQPWQPSPLLRVIKWMELA